MKIWIFSALIVFLLFGFSCSRNTYQHSIITDKKLDFNSGSWLVNHVEVELHARAKKELTDLVLRKLRKAGGNYIYFIESVKPDTLNPAPPRFNVSTERLQRLESTTIFDYLVNTKLEINEEASEITASIVIYNIKKKEKLYSQETVKKISFPGLFLSSRCLTRNIRKTMSKALKKFEEKVKIQKTQD